MQQLWLLNRLDVHHKIEISESVFLRMWIQQDIKARISVGRWNIDEIDPGCKFAKFCCLSTNELINNLTDFLSITKNVLLTFLLTCIFFSCHSFTLLYKKQIKQETIFTINTILSLLSFTCLLRLWCTVLSCIIFLCFSMCYWKCVNNVRIIMSFWYFDSCSADVSPRKHIEWLK